MTGPWKWILTIGLSLVLFSYGKGTRANWKQKKVLKTIERNLEEIRQSNRKLALEIQRLKTDPGAIEQVARKELGLIQKGEVEYRFMAPH